MNKKPKKVTLNVQGLSRRNEGFMSCLIPDDGELFVSVDLGQGEPTCTTHFSKDPNYHAACFGMVGKTPYFNQRGLLMIDDIYLMTASRSPLGSELMHEAFDRQWNGKSFQDQWLEDPEVIKDELKKTIRAFHKTLCLALGYSMGPTGLVKRAYEEGQLLTKDQASEFYIVYWQTYAKVKKLGKMLESMFKKKGSLVNPFGYRLVPNADYKCLNYFIQSSVSGIMHVLGAKYEALYPKARYITTIHDENLYSIPEDDEEMAKKMFYEAVESLNKDLNWSVDMRCGWKVGRNMYEAK